MANTKQKAPSKPRKAAIKRIRKSPSNFFSKLFTSKRGQLLVTVMLFAIVGAVYVVYGLAATNTVKVADHPQAILQSTSDGKRLHTLKTWHDRIYAGFGDYSANTGPIALTPFNGVSFGTQEFAADTEAIYQFREINGKLYGLSADPKSSADVVIGTYNADGTVTWVNKRFVGTTHAFDIFTLTGNDLWIVGSQGVYAKAWRSLDGGVTWQESLSVANINTTRTDDFARFYGAIVQNGKVYVQARDFYGSVHPTSKVFDGQSWSDGPYIGDFNTSDTFAGQNVFHGSFHVGFYDSLSKFDGTKAINVAPTYIYNYTIDGDTLYTLAGDGMGTVYKTKDLVNWTKLGATTSVARSIAVLNGEIYIGGSDGAIYKVTLSDIDISAPTVSVTAPINGATVTGINQLSSTASDNVGVVKVEFLIDGNVVGTDTISPYTYSWNTTTTTNGSHSITARAYDAAGNVATSSAVSVTVSNVPDTTAPVVTISSPVDASKIPTNGRVKITASATDNVGVAKIEVYVDGKLQASANSSSVNTVWNAKKASTGQHSIEVKAFDAVGNQSSATINITK
jgi:Bacterial Ig domain